MLFVMNKLNHNKSQKRAQKQRKRENIKKTITKHVFKISKKGVNLQKNMV